VGQVEHCREERGSGVHGREERVRVPQG
jgi:hypothetical protein